LKIEVPAIWSHMASLVKAWGPGSHRVPRRSEEVRRVGDWSHCCLESWFL